MMSAEAEETQSAFGDGAGPGAPTPLSALEVRDKSESTKFDEILIDGTGCCGPLCTRYQADCRWRVQHGGSCRIHVFLAHALHDSDAG